MQIRILIQTLVLTGTGSNAQRTHLLLQVCGEVVTLEKEKKKLERYPNSDVRSLLNQKALIAMMSRLPMKQVNGLLAKD